MDPDFESIYAKVKEHLDSAGIATGLSEEEQRNILLTNLKEHSDVVADEAPEVLIEEEQAGPTVLSIPKKPTDPYWWDDPKDAQFLEHLILSRRALGRDFAGGLLILGPAGSGKSTSVPQAIKRINRDHGLSLRLTKMDCSTVTDPQKWFGRREIDKDGTRYEQSDFVIAAERGDIILLDDIWRLHPTLHNPIMTLLDGSESVHLSDMNVTIDRHPGTFFIATANEGAQFGGNHRADWAMRERFPYTIERGFPPRGAEIDILTSWTGCDDDGARNLVNVAERSRDLVEQGDLRSPISTRTLVAAALLVASGYTEREALTRTAVPLYDRDSNGVSVGEASERQKILQIMEGKLG